MNKEEARTLGVPEESISAFSKMYHKDVHKEAERIIKRGSNETYRNAIMAMLNLIHDPEALKKILTYANGVYYKMTVQQAEQKGAQNEDNNSL